MVKVPEAIQSPLLQAFAQGYALLVGVGHDLPFTVHNAEWFGDVLKDPERSGYPRSHVTVLTGQAATRNMILEELADFATKPEDSTFIFYFCGHGARVTGPRGTKYYLYPYGFDQTRPNETLISDEDLRRCFADFHPRRLAIFLDCCHAGGVLNPLPNYYSIDELQPDPKWFVRNRVDADYCCVCASRAEQKAYDAKLPSKPCSAFTAALLEAFCGAASDEQDPYVRTLRVAMYCSQRVQAFVHGRHQEPVLVGKGDFAIAFHSGGNLGPRGVPLKGRLYPDVSNVLEVERSPGIFLNRYRCKKRILEILRTIATGSVKAFPAAALVVAFWDVWIHPNFSIPTGIEIENVSYSESGDRLDSSSAEGDIKGHITTISTRRFFGSAPQLRVFVCIDGECGPPSKINDEDGTWFIPNVLFRLPAEKSASGQLQVVLEETPRIGPAKYHYSKTIRLNFPVPKIVLERVCGYEITANTTELPACTSMELKGTASNLLWDRERVCVQVFTHDNAIVNGPAAMEDTDTNTRDWSVFQGQPQNREMTVKVGIDPVTTGSECSPQTVPLQERTFTFQPGRKR